MDSEVSDESANALVAAIKEKNAKIEALNTQMNASKNREVCANCGAFVDKNNVFCGSCGGKINKD